MVYKILNIKTLNTYPIVLKNIRITSAPPIHVPIELPRFANITTSNTLVTLFLQNPFKLNISSERFSKSSTLGFLIRASTIPANQPAAKNGFNDVIGAAKNAVKIDMI